MRLSKEGRLYGIWREEGFNGTKGGGGANETEQGGLKGGPIRKIWRCLSGP